VVGAQALPVCREVVFASLLPDPKDEHCPKAFSDEVQLLLLRDAKTGKYQLNKCNWRINTKH
jgi:hypothetical protein